ncbi:Gyp8 [Kluyveromyces lactis]|nr:Gyp8 [Kluyveromyces lactis]
MSLEWEDTAFDMASLSFISDLNQSKLKRVIVANALQNEDLASLEHLGTSRFGFVNSQLRSKAWFSILQSRVKGSHTCGSLKEPHKDEYQVNLDVNRSFSFIKDSSEKLQLRDLLYDTIVKTLRKFPQLNYYQGYHEVVSVFVLVCDRESLNETVELFTLLYLRDYMMDSLQCTLEQLEVLSQFIMERDADLAKILQLNQKKPIFAIASVLTLLIHNFENFEEDSPIFSIFDIVITTNNLSNLFVVYTELLIYFKEPILKQVEAYEIDFENDMDLIHSVVQQTLLKFLTRSSWDEILTQARLRLNNSTVRVTKYVNKYSSLISVSNIEFSELINVLSKEIEWDASRKIVKASPKIPLFVKWSLVIGIIAAVIKVGSSHTNTIHSSSLIDSLKKVLSP